jgi:tight adherence protein C
MTHLILLTGVLLLTGTVLVLAELRWFARRPLLERLAPYVPGGMAQRTGPGLLSVGSFREAIGPLARSLGARFSRLFGIEEDLDRRLRRVHASLDVTEFRVRQIGWSLSGLGIGALTAAVARPEPAIALLLTVGGPLLAFLVLEQQVTAASDRWKRSLRLELPVVAEQIGMLLGAGYSLTGALDRVGRRGHGTVAEDLRVVLRRIRQGAPEEQALREWADLSDVHAVERLVAVLALSREASDLGRLIATEARAIRRDVHRGLVETMETRAQQVWIPVTVATLLPGVVFIAIPFHAALSGFLR